MRFVLDSYGFVKLGKHLDLRISTEVLKLYDYGLIDDDILKRAIEVNSREFSLKFLSAKYRGTRFKDIDLKEMNRKNIQEIAKEIIVKKGIDKKYQELIKFQKEI